MVIRRTLSRLAGIALLVAAIGCSATSPAEVAPTPNIEATVEARLAQERAIEATIEARVKQEVAAQPTATAYPTYTPVAVPTHAPRPTGTPTPAPTPVPIPTPTPILEHTYVLQWGTEGSGDGQFSWPAGVAVDGSGNVYVSDTLNHRIQKFSPRP